MYGIFINIDQGRSLVLYHYILFYLFNCIWSLYFLDAYRCMWKIDFGETVESGSTKECAVSECPDCQVFVPVTMFIDTYRSCFPFFSKQEMGIFCYKTSKIYITRQKSKQ